MAQDYDALGRYTDARETMESAFTKRHQMAVGLAQLAEDMAGGDDITAATVRAFNVAKAQELLRAMSTVEDEIKSALALMNTNAPKCGKSVMRLSD